MKDALLTQLRRSLRESPPEPVRKPVQAPPSPPEETVDDATLFAQATRGATRLKTTEPLPQSAPKKPSASQLHRRAMAVAEATEQGPISDSAALLHAVEPEESLSFARSGVQLRSLQKLKQGQPHWQAAVDLHGCTVDQAREAVLTLIKEAYADNLQAVKVVHGKGLTQGQALLKTYVNGWLRQIPEVLAFGSAPAREGGTGAVFVLIKRRRETPNA